jgi:hypothetical protein
MFRQRRLGPGGSLTAPKSAICTDKCLIIVYSSALGLRRSYDVIPYKQIISVRLEHGIVSSAVFIKAQGLENAEIHTDVKDERSIHGLRKFDAETFADYIHRKIETAAGGVREHHEHAEMAGAYVYCSGCGSKNSTAAQFCAHCGSGIAP